MLRELAQDTGLTAGVTAVLADTYAGLWVHAPGRVFADMAVAIADGADCVSHIEVFGDRHEVAGPVASMPTTWRMLDRIDPAQPEGDQADDEQPSGASVHVLADGTGDRVEV